MDINNFAVNVCFLLTSASQNVAFQRPAFHSSTQMDMYAHKAVDGNYNTSDDACTLTEAEDAPWWLVELDDVYIVENIVIQTGGKFINSTYTSDYFEFGWTHRGSTCAYPEGASMGPDPPCKITKIGFLSNTVPIP